MEDVWDTKEVLESHGDVHNKMEIQFNSELQISSPTRSPGPPCIQTDAQNASLRISSHMCFKLGTHIRLPSH